MSELSTYQKRIFENKCKKGFNTTNVESEFLLLYGEIAEAFEAYKDNNKEHLAEELADIAIYLLGLAEILDIDLNKEIRRKMEINEKRTYHKNENGYTKKDETPFD